MHQLPETGFLRISQIIGNPKAIPPIPVSKSSWWSDIKASRYPKAQPIPAISLKPVGGKA